VLRQHDELLDISRGDLGELLQEAEMRAYRRRFGQITCANIMSRDVVTAQYDMPLQKAWLLLRQHDIRALPVIDSARRVIGLISDVDLLIAAENGLFGRLDAQLLRFIRRRRKFFTDRPQVVGQIMSHGVPTVTGGKQAVELVPLMADAGLRHIMVVDEQQRLSGIISQADLIAALYRSGLEEEVPEADKQAA
jgi:CBS domain-containing membrane protein